MTEQAAESTPLTPSDRQAVADLYALLSRCFQHPDEEFRAALRSGQFEATLQDLVEPLAMEIDSPPTDETETLREQYLRTFEAYDGEYAPPAESAYEEWWDGTDQELLSGPAAHDMGRRYEAVNADIPPEYPADHVSLLLEYGSLLLEAGNEPEYRGFHREHFDWIPSFRERVERTGESTLYRWAVATLDDVIDSTAAALDVE